MRKFLLVLALGSLAITFGRDKACADPKYGHFDFWIGEWEVTANGKVAGTNTITPIMGGCVLQENWRGASGSKGTSLNFYHPQSKEWRQFWVWQNGTTLPLLKGGFSDGKMILSGAAKDKDGKEVIDRITWFDNKNGTVRQLWEKSRDGGKTWVVSFDGLYTRKK